jgi:hypothetical protein
MKLYIRLIILLIGLVISSGCTSNSPPYQSLPRILPQAELHSHIEYLEDFSVGLGCYYRVNGYVYNSGNGPANTAFIDLSLVDKNRGTIRDSKSLNLGYIGQGGSKTFETTLDGECSRNYRVDALIR